jgi:tetratricopeptide (TPR) repeat protein
LALAQSRGVVTQGLYTKVHALFLLVELGRWDQALEWADEFLATSGDRVDRALVVSANAVRSHVLFQRGLADRAADPERMLALARPLGDIQVLAATLAGCAEFAIGSGDKRRALELLVEFEQVTRDVAPEYRESRLAEVARSCVACGDAELAARMVERSSGTAKRDRLNLDAAAAVVEEARGDDETAAQKYGASALAWADYEYPFEQAHALAGAARCLAALRRDDSVEVVQATELFDELRVAAERRPQITVP